MKIISMLVPVLQFSDHRVSQEFYQLAFLILSLGKLNFMATWAIMSLATAVKGANRS
jgi:hypothetical protein